MKQIEKVYVPRRILFETKESLRAFGKQGCEGLVLWLGHIHADNTCRVERILTPPQESIKSEDGVGYFVNSETLFNLNKFLSSCGLRLLAQVHSHPSRAYHSSADDRYCIVTVEGGFSIVVPNFALGPCDLRSWATYRLISGVWEELPIKKVEAVFSVEDEPVEDNSEDRKLLSKIKKFFI